MRLKFNGKKICSSFTKDEVYDAKYAKDDDFGDGYDILDNSGEWYWFNTKFVNDYFEVIN